MDNSPQENSLPMNSELAGGDDVDEQEDKDEHQDNAVPMEPSSSNDNSLVSVAGSTLEKLAGFAMATSDSRINHHGNDDVETEIYLDDSETDHYSSIQPASATTPMKDQDPSSSPPVAQIMQEQGANQSNTTLLPPMAATSASVALPLAPVVHSDGTANNFESPMASAEEKAPSTPPTSTIATGVSTSSASPDIDASKDILTEGQAFAYVGLCLVTANTLFQALEGTETAHAKESLESFVSKLINRLYRHLDIDTNTQKTIAQLPQMMIQPQDLLETFVADGTQRIVSSQQVDQADFSQSGSSSPVLSRHSTSSQRSDNSAGGSTLETSSVDSVNKSVWQQRDTSNSSSSTLVSETPLSPRLSTSSQKPITVDLRWTLIADLFLISISDSVYDARARVLLKTVGQHLGLDWNEIVLFEKGIMKQLQSTTNDGLLKPDTKSRNDESRKRRMIMMGLATVGGGLVLGLSAGLFAPVIGAGIGAALAGAHITGATATAASAFLAGSGGIAVITSGAAVTGSGLAMKKMARRTAGIDTFEFLSIHDHKRVNVILTISGWLDIGEEDASLPFSTLDPVNGDHFSLLWEPEMLMQLGNALGLLATEVITLTAQEILKHTLLSALLSALAWPMALTRLGYLIDNPWSIALDRAKLAGLVLADSLLMRSYLGFRPVTLVGYSLGARVIFYCLLELGRLDAYGIVENAYLFGAPVTASEIQWRQARSAIAGEFVNGYLRNDWVLGFLFRATTGGLGTVAGLRPLKNVPGLANMDLTSHVEGHLDYRVKVPLLMKLMGLKITSESFLDKEEAILYQRSLKINPNEVLKAPKPQMPSKAELAKSGTLTEDEKMQLEIAFRRPAPKAKIPDLDSLKGLTAEEKEVLREVLMGAAAVSGPQSPAESSQRRR
ncbi:hypothetical protein BGZ54_003355 [Gamsiella multidivaricata]|nr:hypothetical protein BGZ54_003355 [Gamsiella multidivaricata]